MSVYLTLAPRDPIIARDSRPFGAGQGLRMKSLDWPYPSVLAGSLRTLLGKTKGGIFGENLIRELRKIDIAGPLPFFNDALYFPAPKDFIV
ncbi:MAG: type III-B CRISPR module-associated Cmr3 family protein [Candidatus Binatia bacterium]